MILNLNKVSQVAIVVRDIDKAMKFYWEELGVGPWRIWEYGSPLTREMTYRGKPAKHRFVGAETMVGGMGFELVMPLEGETVYKEFLDKKDEGLHHIAYTTNDIDSVLEKFRKAGIGVLQSGKVAKDSYYYVDTGSICGTIIEFYTDFGFRPPDRVYPPE